VKVKYNNSKDIRIKLIIYYLRADHKTKSIFYKNYVPEGPAFPLTEASSTTREKGGGTPCENQ